MQVKDLAKRLADQHLGLELSDAARHFVAEAAYDPVYGARPLKRYLQHQLETRIGRAIIAGEVSDGMTILVDVADAALVVTIREKPPVAAAS